MIFKFILLTLSLNVLALNDGIYKCHKGNSNSICKQKIKVYESAIKVTYVGYCYGMGSNIFYCDNNSCESGNQVIEILDEGYSWETKNFNIKCDLFLPTDEGQLP